MRNFGILGMALLFIPAVASASDVGTANPNSCNQLFGLSSGTVAQGVDKNIMNPTTCDAYQYIYSISTKQNTADLAHVTRLNNTFAVCSANFFKAYSQRYGVTLRVTSTWRSQADQQRVSTSPTSNHTRGLAIDVHPSDENYDRLRDFAASNKQFGVCFARPQYNGRPDLPHMTAAGIGSRTEDCGQFGITKLCDEGGTFDPNATNEAVPLNNNGQTPTSGLSDLLRQYMGGGQQPTNTGVPAANSIPASSQPFSGSVPSGGSAPSSPGISSGSGASTNPGVTTNTSGYTTAVPSSLSTAYGSSPSPVSDSLGSGPTTNSTSTFDLLAALAGGTPTTTTVATGTPLALNSNLNQVGTTLDTQGVQSVTLTQNTVSNAVVLSGTGGQQTFTSQDLQYSPTGSYTPPTNTTLRQRVLENLKQTLLRLLDVLRPFSYVRQQGATLEYGD